MLKWTVKKRLTDDALSVYDDNAENNNNNGIRKIHSRRSMGDGLTDNHRNNRNIRRRSLGNFQNSNNNNNNYNSNDKENNGELTPVRRIQNRQSSTPLNDSSNFHKTFKRKHHVIAQSEKVRIASPTMSPISMATSKDIFFKEPPTVIFQQNYAPTLPSFDIEYSPTSLIMKAAQHNPIINKRQAVLNCSINSYDNNDEIPSKRLKFDALDMSYEFKPEMATTSSPLSTPLTVRKFPDNKIQLTSISSLSDSEPSLNSSEVGDTTLQQMIDDILASARHGKKFKQCFPKTKVNVQKQPVHTQRDRNSNFVKPLSIDCDNMEQKSIEKLLSASKIAQAAERTLIIADDAAKNEREVREKTPQKTDIVETVDLKNDESCHLKRQNAVRRKNTSNENKNRKKLSDSDKANKENVHHDSTIQKCLSFSSANYDEISEKFKRSSVASNSSSSSASYVSQSKCMKNSVTKGSVELATTCDENRKKISIHVKKCRNLMKLNDACHINAYVKCALTVLKSSASQNTYQRTAVHKNSTCPVFDHNFVFDIDENEDSKKYFQIAVWHRNKNLKKSELLGCLTIPVQDVITHNIEGSFLLQSQSALTKPMPLIREIEEKPLDPIIEPNNDLLKYLELNSDENCGNSQGRTPLTMTKVIHKQTNGSYGFEISWSKPPKINTISLEQTKSGIKKGDYLIFIDEINVVTMPKDEVIELIRKERDCLKLEIFRPTEKCSSNEMIEKLAAQSTPVAVSKNVSSLSYEAKCAPVSDLTETPKSHRSSCHFKQPKIHFQPSVGNGIFV
ncbi:general transcriptional corepressor trfA-like [Chironomus tepperi]|uniref:general transcriptional corepressor trfA-like n=1 Tax=Chironomus tepperi TaxID=113505 RepID=UPI00391F9EF8